MLMKVPPKKSLYKVVVMKAYINTLLSFEIKMN